MSNSLRTSLDLNLAVLLWPAVLSWWTTDFAEPDKDMSAAEPVALRVGRGTFPGGREHNMKKIGILGSGMVGKALAAGFIKHGYEVMVGSRSPGKLEEWKGELGQGLRTGEFSETAAYGDVLVLATKGSAAVEALALSGPENTAGKTVLDATNPIADAEPVGGVLKFFTSLDESLLERLQSAFPDARFVKAFSSVGAAFMVDPPFSSRPTMFICGNDDSAKRDAKEILERFGWDAEDMGGVEAARAIEPLCMLWCIPGFREDRWTHAFKLLKL